MKKIINFFLDFTVTQKVFILIGLFTLVSGGRWLALFKEGDLYRTSYNDIALGICITCLVGFFLFWKRKADDEE